MIIAFKIPYENLFGTSVTKRFVIALFDAKVFVVPLSKSIVSVLI